MLFDPVVRYAPKNISLKFPVQKEKFEFAYDSEHHQMVDNNVEQDEFKRIALRQAPKGTIKTLKPQGLFYWFKQTAFDDEFRYHEYLTLFKDTLQGDLSIITPDQTKKLLLHDIKEPHQYKEGRIIEPNQYASNPFEADIIPELPPYFALFNRFVNMTDENVPLFRKYNLLTL